VCASRLGCSTGSPIAETSPCSTGSPNAETFPVSMADRSPSVSVCQKKTQLGFALGRGGGGAPRSSLRPPLLLASAHNRVLRCVTGCAWSDDDLTVMVHAAGYCVIQYQTTPLSLPSANGQEANSCVAPQTARFLFMCRFPLRHKFGVDARTRRDRKQCPLLPAT
jgi:hypothetical protein